MKKELKKKQINKIAKLILIILGIVYIIIGLIFIITSLRSITGFSVIEEINPPMSRIFGLFFITMGAGQIFFAIRKPKKGQAALEFLFTYGWAVMAMVSVLGVLIYMGIFSSDFFGSSNTILLSTPFTASTSIFQSYVLIELTNNGDFTTTISEIKIAGCGTLSTSTQIQAGKTSTLSVTCTQSISKLGGNIDIKYTKTGSTLQQLSQGTIKGKASADALPGGQGGGEAICGNGIQEPENNEECDDGNLENGDGCSSSCLITFECSDGIDNDGDSFVDLEDPSCNNDPLFNDESLDTGEGDDK